MTATDCPNLLAPYVRGLLNFRNRVVLAPLTRSRAGTERMPNALMAEYYAQRAGAGLLITEATVVSKQGIGWLNSPGIYEDEQAKGWKLTTEAVHEQGGKIVLQLWHCGRASHSDFHGGALPVSASAIALAGDHIHTPNGKKAYETPRALETEEIAGIVAEYRAAANLARAAGFDGIEVHAANGYLLDQFLQSRTNQRSDDYGGSFENRFRLLREVVTAVTDVFPIEKIGVRLSPNGVFNDMGSADFREMHGYAMRELSRMGLGYLHVMDGLAFGFHGLGEPMTLAEVRELYSGTVIANCGYTKESAEAAIASGHADLVAFGRPFISNPDLVERFRHGWPLEPAEDMSHWYSFEAEGYTDYPAYSG